MLRNLTRALPSLKNLCNYTHLKAQGDYLVVMLNTNPANSIALPTDPNQPILLYAPNSHAQMHDTNPINALQQELDRTDQTDALKNLLKDALVIAHEIYGKEKKRDLSSYNHPTSPGEAPYPFTPSTTLEDSTIDYISDLSQNL